MNLFRLQDSTKLFRTDVIWLMVAVHQGAEAMLRDQDLLGDVDWNCTS